MDTGLAQEEANRDGEGTTLGKKHLNDVITEDMDLQHPLLKLVRRCVRLLQFICLLVAFILFVARYKPYYPSRYVSPASTYVILMAYAQLRWKP
ncbi:hypothetical protein DVH05_007151 [Phytophthora capsici]|nr:hypothetical protein DVH05_007151 [Phytophthora capsici]